MTAARFTMIALAIPFLLTAGLVASAGDQRSYDVTIATDRPTRMQPEDAAQIVLELQSRAITGVSGKEAPGPGDTADVQIDPPLPEILSVTCAPGDAVADYLPEGTGITSMPQPAVWVVRARGRFSKSIPGGGSIVRGWGVYILDDETGDILGYGSVGPEPARD